MPNDRTLYGLEVVVLGVFARGIASVELVRGELASSSLIDAASSDALLMQRALYLAWPRIPP